MASLVTDWVGLGLEWMIYFVAGRGYKLHFSRYLVVFSRFISDRVDIFCYPWSHRSIAKVADFANKDDRSPKRRVHLKISTIDTNQPDYCDYLELEDLRFKHWGLSFGVNITTQLTLTMISSDHTMDLVVLTKYGGDCVSITLNATPELFAFGDAFGSPPEPEKQAVSSPSWS